MSDLVLERTTLGGVQLRFISLGARSACGVAGPHEEADGEPQQPRDSQNDHVTPLVISPGIGTRITNINATRSIVYPGNRLAASACPAAVPAFSSGSPVHLRPD